jgi:hypothetical protein
MLEALQHHPGCWPNWKRQQATLTLPEAEAIRRSVERSAGALRALLKQVLVGWNSLATSTLTGGCDGGELGLGPAPARNEGVQS